MWLAAVPEKIFSCLKMFEINWKLAIYEQNTYFYWILAFLLLLSAYFWPNFESCLIDSTRMISIQALNNLSNLSIEVEAENKVEAEKKVEAENEIENEIEAENEIENEVEAENEVED